MTNRRPHPEDPADRLNHCEDMLFCLSCLDFQLVGGGEMGQAGLAFLLRLVADEVGSIAKEVQAGGRHGAREE